MYLLESENGKSESQTWVLSYKKRTAEKNQRITEIKTIINFWIYILKYSVTLLLNIYLKT